VLVAVTVRVSAVQISPFNGASHPRSLVSTISSSYHIMGVTERKIFTQRVA
jgi:hypothetical protein